MNPRLSMLAVILVPGLGLLACGRRLAGLATLSLAVFAAVAALPEAYGLAHAIALLVSLRLVRRGAL